MLTITEQILFTIKNSNKMLTDKASRKIFALARDTPFMGLSKRKLLIILFLHHSSATAHLFRCTLVCSNNRKIYMFHER